MMNDELKTPRPLRGDDLRVRTKAFALRIIRVCAALPKRPEAQVIGRQLRKSGTSPGAHYREACRARSVAEFVSKMEGGLQELEESTYWPEIRADARIFPAARLAPLRNEAEELIRIFVSSAQTARKRPDRRSRM